MREFHPGFGQVVPSERSFLSDDPDTAVAQTIQRMAIYAREDSRAPAIQRLAGQLRGATIDETIFRVWNWIRARVRFVQDSELAAPISDNASIAEVLIRPIDLIRMQDAQEDCDGFSMLGGALFLALGVPCHFVTVAADPHMPDQFSHVYLWVNGAAFDASHGRYLGWEAENRFGKRQLWSVNNGMPLIRSRRGLRGLGDCSDPNPDTLQCPDGSTYTGPALSSPAPAPSSGTLAFPWFTGSTGGGTPTATPSSSAAPNFWDALTGQGVTAALSILKAKYAVPPPGTIISTPGGFIATAGAPNTSSLALTSSGAFGSIPTIVWIGAAGLVLLMVLKRK